MINKITYLGQKDLTSEITSLLENAFPVDERPPTPLFYQSLKRAGNQLYCYFNDNDFIGFAYVSLYQDVCYLFFLAVKEDKRHQGYGGFILEDVKSSYQDKVILLGYEEVNEKYPNYDERKKREQFYLSHGFKDNKLRTNEFGVIYQTAYYGKRLVTYQEYQEVFKMGFGSAAAIYLKKAS